MYYENVIYYKNETQNDKKICKGFYICKGILETNRTKLNKKLLRYNKKGVNLVQACLIGLISLNSFLYNLTNLV